MKIITCTLVIVSCLPLHAQNPMAFTDVLKSLTNTATREGIFEKLKATEQVPFTEDDSVLFVYRGEGTDVKWMGDFNGWGYNKAFNNTGTQLSGSDIWVLKACFPNDARLDYKIVVNNTEWMLDPLNPHQQWSGVGGGSPNSELRMPAWREDKEAIKRENTPEGKLSKDILINSKSLSYQITYSVYVPDGYNTSKKYPVLYVTDGYEYLHENMGNTVATLNNLISEGKIKPIVAVFIDHREPVNRSNNRRMTELAMNEKYLNFFVNELTTQVEAKYSISKKPEERAIIGTSMGGLTAAYFSFSRPDVFGLAGIQSPAFWFRPEIYTLCDNPEKPPVKVFMTTGTINDTEEGAQKMKAILDKNTCTYQYKEVNQGHSWGNWRDLLDDILIYFFPVN